MYMKKNTGFLFVILLALFCFCSAAAQSVSNVTIDLTKFNIDPITGEYIPEDEIIRRWEEQNRRRIPAIASSKGASEDSIVVYSTDDFTKELRKKLVVHEPEINIELHTDFEITDFTEYVNNALIHTKVPNEGDYIKYNMQGIGFDGNAQYDGSEYVYNLQVLVNFYHNKEQEAEATQEIERIFKSLKPDGDSDAAKIRAVYDYVSKNVVYDYEHLNDSTYLLKHSAYAAIIQKTAVCQGYATMTYRLLLMYGIDVRYVHSIKTGNHGWNIVKVGDKWYHLDATWASPTGTDRYFLKSYQNIRADDSNDGEHTLDINDQAWINDYNMSDQDYGYDINVTSISVSGPDELKAGESGNYTAAVLPSDAANKKVLWTVTLNGQTVSYAKISETGKLTLTSNAPAGKVLIVSAKSTDGTNISGQKNVKIIQPLATSVTIQNSSGADITGKTVTTHTSAYQLKAVAAPSGAAQKFTWTSSNTGIATVDTTGKVAFKKAGSVKITAAASDGSKKTASVTLKYVPLATSVTIQNSSGADITGKTVTTHTAAYQLKAAAAPSGAAQKFTWTSSNTGVATVDTTGKVAFKKAGSVKITAAANDGSKKTASVTLKYVPLATSVTIQNSSGAYITGKTVTTHTAAYQLKAAAAPSGAAQKFTWTSGSTDTATVDANGMVSFLKAGSVKITATAADGSKKSASVTLKFQPQKPVLEIKDTNIRGKNKEIQVVIPWSADLIKVESTLYDESTGKEIKPAFRERIDSTGNNKVVSYVGSPLENGNVYRFKLRVYNGQWSNYVEKYAMPISNVYGATVVAGNKTMFINTQHREPATGTRYMVFDAATQKELAYKAGTKTDTTWKHEGLQNGKLYYVVAVPYRDYKGQRLWGPNENRIYFIPMGIPDGGKVSFSGSNATVSIAADSTVDGIRVLYRTVGGALKNGCEAKGAKCTIKGLNSGTAYEFYALKYKVADGKTYYSTGAIIPYKTAASELSAPQMNPVVAMSNSGYTTFTIRKSANAEGISVLCKIGSGNFEQACEKEGNTCATTLDVTKNYTFYIMQYKTVNGKKVYSPGIVARDFSSGKAPDAERLYTDFTLADGIVDMNEVYNALDGYMGEDALLMAEALAVISENIVSKDAEELEADTFYEDDGFDYSGFDSDEPYGEYETVDFDDGNELEEFYDEGIDPESGFEESFDDIDEGVEESEDFSMYRFGDDEKLLPPAPSFNNP